MIIETSDGRKVKISHPAGLKDTPKIVSAVFAVNDRENEVDFNKNKRKTETTILGSTQRAPLSTTLGEGMIIQAETTKQEKSKIKDFEKYKESKSKNTMNPKIESLEDYKENKNKDDENVI